MKSKKSTPPLIKHRSHNVEIRPSRAHNYALYYCQDCNTFVSWLSKMESQEAYRQGLVKQLPEFFKLDT